jgi:dTDP-4-dehydrorhamnose 3,5-epimerase-like enzyme
LDVVDLELPGLKLLKPHVFGDSHAFFVESYERERSRSAAIVERILATPAVRGVSFAHHATDAKR